MKKNKIKNIAIITARSGSKRIKNKKNFRKGIYYDKNFEKGVKISRSKILIGRPETKLKISQIKKILNKKIRKKVSKYHEIKLSDFANK